MPHGIQDSHIYYRDGIERARIPYKLAGQLWYRNNWGTFPQQTYPDHTNNAEAIGWADPRVYRFADIKLNPKRVFVLRHYSGCAVKPWLPKYPWYECEIFEGHILGQR